MDNTLEFYPYNSYPKKLLTNKKSFEFIFQTISDEKAIAISRDLVAWASHPAISFVTCVEINGIFVLYLSGENGNDGILLAGYGNCHITIYNRIIKKCGILKTPILVKTIITQEIMDHWYSKIIAIDVDERDLSNVPIDDGRPVIFQCEIKFAFPMLPYHVYNNDLYTTVTAIDRITRYSHKGHYDRYQKFQEKLKVRVE
jgi:hypothetical protein